MSDRRLHTEVLLQAGRLLLEYDESSGVIHSTLTAAAAALTHEPCHVAVSYHGVVVSLGGDSPVLGPVRELRYNTAVQARVHQILGRLRRGDLSPESALTLLRRVEADTPRHPRWLAVVALAAAGLAALSGADGGAVAVAGLAAGLGLFARQELARRHVGLLVLPLTAAFIGAVLGGLAVRLGWTRSPGLVLIVPALMLVPGPHLINALLDLIDNCLPMCLARLGLAVGILLASSLGVVVGVELTLPDAASAEQAGTPGRLGLASDVVLAGLVTCGYAVVYNTPRRLLWMAAEGGMAGHGLRFLALDAGFRLEAATFAGGLTVGAVSAWTARSERMPVAAVSFAGAVTMIPGLHLYRALIGARHLARLGELADPGAVAGTLGNALQGGSWSAGWRWGSSSGPGRCRRWPVGLTTRRRRVTGRKTTPLARHFHGTGTG